MSRRDPRSASPYLNFDLLIERQGDHYRIRVIGSPSGEEDDTFPAPFTDSELELLTGRLEGARGRMRRMNSPQLALAKEMGGRLYQTAMTPAIRRSLARAVDQAELQEAAGVRLRLRLDSAPELAVLPWELMYDPDPRVGRFVALAEETPLVRYLNLPERIRPLKVTPPVRVLVVIANPADDRYPELDVEAEWRRLQDEALKDSIDQGLISLTRVRRGTLSALQQELLEADYNVLHYIGHGRFDQQHQDGLLVFEGERGGVNEVSAERFGALLHNERQLGLAVVNACEGGRAAATDPYAGMAQTLVRMGVPAVVAMQFEISDRAAITFARYFYWNIARGRPVDTAITHARMAVFQQVSEVEWATPVLYMRAPDGRIFDVAAVAARPAPGPIMAAAAVAAPAPAAPPAAAVTIPRPPKPEPVKRPREPRRPSALVTGVLRAGALAIGLPAQAARGTRAALSSTASAAARLPVAVAGTTLAAARTLRRIPPQTVRAGLAGVVVVALTGTGVLVASAWPRGEQASVDLPQPTALSPLPATASPTVAPTGQLSETIASASPSPTEVATATPVTTSAEPTPAPSVLPQPTPVPEPTVTAPPTTTPRTVTCTFMPPATPYPTSGPIGTGSARGVVRWTQSPVSCIGIRLMRGGQTVSSTVSDANGVFRFTSLPAGSYTIFVEQSPDYQPGSAVAAKNVVAGSEVDFGTAELLKYIRVVSPVPGPALFTTVTQPFDLAWNAVSGASSYYVEVFEASQFTLAPVSSQPVMTRSVAAPTQATTSLQVSVTTIPAGKYYRWHVFAYSGGPSTAVAKGTGYFMVP